MRNRRPDGCRGCEKAGSPAATLRAPARWENQRSHGRRSGQQPCSARIASGQQPEARAVLSDVSGEYTEECGASAAL